MTERTEAIERALETLDNDLEVLGWDQPSRLYFLEGDLSDPTCRLAGIMPTYPPADMLAAYDQGARVPEGTQGLMCSTEGYRHLFFEEVLERGPEMFEGFRKQAEKDLKRSISKEEFEKAARSYYENEILRKMPGPANLPDDKRVEVRTLVLVFKDGTTMHYARDRGSDKGIHYEVSHDPESLARVRVPSAMYLFLHGVRPDGEHPDPMQAVKDVETLKYLSDLPTTDNQ